jgi:RNA methyltransferase, TrmH family
LYRIISTIALQSLCPRSFPASLGSHCVPTSLGAHNPRVALARDLLSAKGRKAHGLFSFEGPTLLAQALQVGTPVRALYVTAHIGETTSLVPQVQAQGIEVFIVDERTMRKISDVETPTGILAVAEIRLYGISELLAIGGVILVLADLNDPGNAGTLLRSAEAFGVGGVLFGSRGVEPHHPKVVRSAMGAIFRQRIGVCDPLQLKGALTGWEVIGLAADGEPLHRVLWRDRTMLLVGNERHGLGPWQPLCGRVAAIPMRAQSESLNAAVAGSIALYEASRRTDASPPDPLATDCQGSPDT